MKALRIEAIAVAWLAGLGTHWPLAGLAEGQPVSDIRTFLSATSVGNLLLTRQYERASVGGSRSRSTVEVRVAVSSNVVTDVTHRRVV